MSFLPGEPRVKGLRRPTPAEVGTTLRYVDDPTALVAGNALRLLRNGREAFPAWLAAIDAAQERISMEMYIFADDQIGRRFGEALAAAARRGVVVRVLYDYVGCRDTSEVFWRNLREAGVQVSAYHKYRIWRPRFWTLFRRNHRKTLIVDGKVGFTGGINIADEWVPAEQGGEDWRDAAVEVAGPAAAVLEAVFLRTWNRRARKRFRLRVEELATPEPRGSSPVAVVANRELRERFTIRAAGLHAIRESERRVWLVNPYFIPDHGVTRALTGATKRGVDVRVLVPAHSDVPIVDYASRATFHKLLDGGVRIFEHKHVVHTKALLVDDAFVSIGSYNLDRMSLTYNLELVVNAIDHAFAADLARMFELELEHSYPVQREIFDQRPPLDRVLERLAYALRLWL